MVKRIFKLVWIPTLILMVGIGLNQLVIRLNDGMPVPNIETWDRWTNLTQSTRMAFLGDILPGFYSIGDVLIVAGLLIYLIMFLNNLKRRAT